MWSHVSEFTGVEAFLESAAVSAPNPTTRNLHIFLAKEGLRDPSELLREPDTYHHEPVRTRHGFLGLLFTRPSVPRPPDWLGFFSGSVDLENLSRLIVSSASAVLITESGGRTFLLTFGYGRSMLSEGVVEPRFGLKATLNAINAEKIRSLDRKSFERIERLSREQLSRDSGFHAFGLNVEQDLLCAVVGTPDDRMYGRRLAGKDALTTFIDCALEDLPILLELYLLLSQNDRYRKLFPWVDNISEVTDTWMRERLNLELVHRIRRRELDDIVLAPPELIDWEEFDGFVYRTSASAQRHMELDWEDFFRAVQPPDHVSLQDLKSHKVYCKRTDGVTSLQWTLHRCISGEIMVEGSRYVITDGRWYVINDEFVARVTTSVSGLPCCSEILPPYMHTSERAYLCDAAAGSGEKWALMDRIPIPTGTAYGQIEFCDLFSDEKRMIHVKRYAGSAPLSHLFAQGVVAARLYQTDGSFRHRVNENLPLSHRLAEPASSIDSHQYEVAYAIIGSTRRPPRLPFFSMVNLRGAIEILAGLGYRVTLTHID